MWRESCLLPNTPLKCQHLNPGGEARGCGLSWSDAERSETQEERARLSEKQMTRTQVGSLGKPPQVREQSADEALWASEMYGAMMASEATLS